MKLRNLCIVFGFFVLYACGTKKTTAIKQSVSSTPYDNYVLLVSLDGFRWDYLEKYNLPNLSRFVLEGSQAESLIPSYPSKTFPNHYTIATGMYPDNHGLIGNSFFSHALNTHYAIRDRSTVENGDFYGGTPIWVHAEKSGITTASYFFVGTEAPIQGYTPTYYHKYDGSIPNKVRIKEVLRWLDMPLEQRPRFIAMYFSDADDIGHRYSPQNEDKIKEAVTKLDLELGILMEGIAKTKLPVDIVIVSDHGMKTIAVEKSIAIERIQNDTLYTLINNGTLVNIHPKGLSPIDTIYSYLKALENNFKVYKTADVPYFEHPPKNKNWGPLQVVPNPGYYFNNARAIGVMKRNKLKVFGQHGYPTDLSDMHGIFYARGPNIKPNHRISSIKNIHVYPLLCKLLGLDLPPDIDGKWSEIKDVYRTPITH